MADSSDIVVVGVCGAGKSTLVRGLRALGYKARVCVQEHSGVPALWCWRGRPWALVYLEASLEAVCRRRSVRWDEEVLARQHERLADARKHCDLYLDTTPLTAVEVRERVVAFLLSLPGYPSTGATLHI